VSGRADGLAHPETSGGTAANPRPITPALLRQWPLPTPTGSKTARGQVLVVGGARRTPGAPVLSGQAALRMGAGRLTLAVAESVATAVAVAVPESGVEALPESATGSITGVGAAGALRRELDRADAMLIGPGLDDAEGTVRLVEEVVPLLAGDARIVLDAYGFTVLPELAPEVRGSIAGRLVTNCNTAELARLTGTGEIGVEDVGAPAVELAARFGAVVSCHGWIATPAGEVWRGTTGDTGLGTSESGDVLAGAIVGLVSRGAEPDRAAVWASHVHASAGDTLAARYGRIGYLARDLLPELPVVLSALRGD